MVMRFDGCAVIGNDAAKVCMRSVRYMGFPAGHWWCVDLLRTACHKSQTQTVCTHARSVSRASFDVLSVQLMRSP